jgi:hypothetical protein
MESYFVPQLNLDGPLQILLQLRARDPYRQYDENAHLRPDKNAQNNLYHLYTSITVRETPFFWPYI